MNNNHQLLNNIQHQSGQNPPPGKKQQPGETVLESPNKSWMTENHWNFLGLYQNLLRKSSLIILVTLGRNFTEKFHVRNLSRTLHYDVSLISKNLKQLEIMGLVIHEDVGNLVLYQANMNNILLKQMKICFTLFELNNLVMDLEKVTTNLILYGSCARGEDTSHSDIDLFIETNDKKKVRALLDTYQKKITRPLSPIINTSNETYTLKLNDNNLYTIIQQGMVLNRGDNVL